MRMINRIMSAVLSFLIIACFSSVTAAEIKAADSMTDESGSAEDTLYPFGTDRFAAADRIANMSWTPSASAFLADPPSGAPDVRGIPFGAKTEGSDMNRVGYTAGRASESLNPALQLAGAETEDETAPINEEIPAISQVNTGYIYNGTININTTGHTIKTNALKVLSSNGKYYNIGTTSVSYDPSVAVYVVVNVVNNAPKLQALPLGFTPSDSMSLIFAYQNRNIYFTEQRESITVDGSYTNFHNRNKKVACLGDSFTAGTSGTAWWGYINKNTQINMIGLGVSGTRMVDTYTTGNGTTYKCFIDRIAEDNILNIDGLDLIVIFGGINDSTKLRNNQMAIGSITDAARYDSSVTNGFSFIARVKYLIELIQTAKPGVPILGVIPPDYSEGRTDTEEWYDSIEQIRVALREVYAYYGIPFVDLDKECQEMYINDYNLSAYRVDGLSNMHPSPAGHEAIGKVIYNKGIRDMFWM